MSAKDTAAKTEQKKSALELLEEDDEFEVGHIVLRFLVENIVFRNLRELIGKTFLLLRKRINCGKTIGMMTM